MRLIRYLPALLLAALAFGACGDDDEREATPTPQLVEVSLFFANQDATGQVEVARQVAAPATVEAVISLLLEGPTQSERDDRGATQAIPDGVSLLSAEVSGGTATLDFSEEMLDYGGGSARVLAIEDSIRLTATAIEGIDDVVILVAGQPDALQP